MGNRNEIQTFRRAAPPVSTYAQLVERAMYQVNNPSAWPEGFNQDLSDLFQALATAIETLERERDEARRDRDALRKWWDENPSLIHHRAEAAEAQVAKLKEAMKPFAEYMGERGDLNSEGEPLPDEEGVGWVYLTQADFRRAREALKDTSP